MNALVALDARAVVNPNNCQVLDIVKDLEQGYADEDVLHAVIAIPPEGDAAGQKRKFDRAEDSSLPPVFRLSPKKQNRHDRESKENLARFPEIFDAKAQRGAKRRKEDQEAGWLGRGG